MIRCPELCRLTQIDAYFCCPTRYAYGGAAHRDGARRLVSTNPAEVRTMTSERQRAANRQRPPSPPKTPEGKGRQSQRLPVWTPSVTWFCQKTHTGLTFRLSYERGMLTNGPIEKMLVDRVVNYVAPPALGTSGDYAALFADPQAQGRPSRRAGPLLRTAHAAPRFVHENYGRGRACEGERGV